MQPTSETNKFVDLLGRSLVFFIKLMNFQFTGPMKVDIYGSYLQFDRTLPFSCFNLLDEKEMRKCFNWNKICPWLIIDYASKGSKVDLGIYFFQEYQARYFLNPNMQK